MTLIRNLIKKKLNGLFYEIAIFLLIHMFKQRALVRMFGYPEKMGLYHTFGENLLAIQNFVSSQLLYGMCRNRTYY